MRYLDNISIRRQLTWIIMLTTGAALLVTVAAFAWHDLHSFRRDLAARLQISAEITGNLCTAALTFGGADIAKETVEGLRADPRVMAAVVFDAAGKTFASYTRPGLLPGSQPAQPSAPGVVFSPDHLRASHLITKDGEVLGTVVIQSDLVELKDRKTGYIILAFGVLFGAGGLATLLSLRLQRIVSEPILALAGTARTVTREQHYAVRASRPVGGEIGLLVDDFNRMLAEIEDRDGQFRRARDELEARVKERTAELTAANRELTAQIAKWRDTEAERQKLVSLVENSSDCIGLADLRGTPFFLNQAGCNLLGVDPGNPPENWTIEHVLTEKYRARYREWRRSQTAVPTPWEGDTEVCHLRNGESIPVSMSLFAILEPGTGKPVCQAFVMRDMRQHRRLEDQLRQAQKLEAIGQLAGGVAHDFNNILAAMLLQLDLMQMGSDLTAETRSALKELEEGANRAANLIQQLLLFSRRQVMQIKPLDLNEVLASLLKMLRRLLGEHIELTFKGETGPVWVDADAGMMDQVVMNLCVNARDAMPKGGRLTISTKHVQLDDTVSQTNAEARPGRFVCLSVTDTGCGMGGDLRKRIFEPFFTTKEVGKGTGLGLATVYGIVNQHRGWVEVQSEVGRGSVFRVFLPARTEEAPVRPAVDTPIPRGNETILVVEDDESVRKMVVRCLQHSGYHVLEAASGTEALQRWNQHTGQIALLLTDMVMPGEMTGLELAQRLQQQAPKLKVIISSGYSLEMSRLGAPTEPGMTYLPKPYQTTTLATTVRNCLDQP